MWASRAGEGGPKTIAETEGHWGRTWGSAKTAPKCYSGEPNLSNELLGLVGRKR